jgi:hypothetical protein
VDEGLLRFNDAEGANLVKRHITWSNPKSQASNSYLLLSVIPFNPL